MPWTWRQATTAITRGISTTDEATRKDRLKRTQARIDRGRHGRDEWICNGCCKSMWAITEVCRSCDRRRDRHELEVLNGEWFDTDTGKKGLAALDARAEAEAARGNTWRRQRRRTPPPCGGGGGSQYDNWGRDAYTNRAAPSARGGRGHSSNNRRQHSTSPPAPREASPIEPKHDTDLAIEMSPSATARALEIKATELEKLKAPPDIVWAIRRQAADQWSVHRARRPLVKRLDSARARRDKAEKAVEDAANKVRVAMADYDLKENEIAALHSELAEVEAEAEQDRGPGPTAVTALARAAKEALMWIEAHVQQQGTGQYPVTLVERLQAVQAALDGFPVYGEDPEQDRRVDDAT